jgi:hypothetical protein
VQQPLARTAILRYQEKRAIKLCRIGKESEGTLTERIGAVIRGFLYSVLTWYPHHGRSRRYRAQSHIAAAWVAREIRKLLSKAISLDLEWQLDQFQLFLARAIFLELERNDGFYPITNSPFLSPAALFAQAIQDARIYPPQPVIDALPHMRIRIVPGWVKVYSIGHPNDAPLVLYPEEHSR